MKNKIIISLILSTLFACKHKDDVGIKQIIALNTITLQDNGKTYTDSMAWMKWSKEVKAVYDTATPTYIDSFNEMKCRIRKTKDGALFSLNLNNPSAQFPFRLTIVNAHGPVDGVGVYRAYSAVAPQKNEEAGINAYFTDISYCSFTEAFANSITYKCDSAIVQITNANGDTVIGNYELWLTGTTAKTIKGSINWSRAD